MKVKVVLDDKVPAASTSLMETANEVSSVVLEAMKPVCPVYDVDSRDHAETHEHVNGEFSEGKVDFTLTDLPYDVKYECNMNNSLHHVFTPENMRDLVKLWLQVLPAGLHGRFLSSWMQFP